MRENLREYRVRLGGRVTRGNIEVDRWTGGILKEDRSKGLFDDESDLESHCHTRRPSGRRDPEVRRKKTRIDVGSEGEKMRGLLERSPSKPKIDFPAFKGGDPYECLDKAEQYFQVYEIPREELVTLATFHLEE